MGNEHLLNGGLMELERRKHMLRTTSIDHLDMRESEDEHDLTEYQHELEGLQNDRTLDVRRAYRHVCETDIHSQYAVLKECSEILEYDISEFFETELQQNQLRLLCMTVTAQAQEKPEMIMALFENPQIMERFASFFEMEKDSETLTWLLRATNAAFPLMPSEDVEDLIDTLSMAINEILANGETSLYQDILELIGTVASVNIYGCDSFVNFGIHTSLIGIASDPAMAISSFGALRRILENYSATDATVYLEMLDPLLKLLRTADAELTVQIILILTILTSSPTVKDKLLDAGLLPIFVQMLDVQEFIPSCLELFVSLTYSTEDFVEALLGIGLMSKLYPLATGETFRTTIAIFTNIIVSTTSETTDIFDLQFVDGLVEKALGDVITVKKEAELFIASWIKRHPTQEMTENIAELIIDALGSESDDVIGRTISGLGAVITHQGLPEVLQTEDFKDILSSLDQVEDTETKALVRWLMDHVQSVLAQL